MTDIEKVKQGLYRCFVMCNESFDVACGRCPYKSTCYPDGETFVSSKPVYTDTIALIDEMQEEIERLKAHEAKLLTFDEVKKHYSIPNELHGDIKKTIDYENDIVPLYLECTYEDEWVVHWRDYHNISMHLDSWENDYGKTWRCWTKKPTQEQKKAVKWDAKADS